MKTADLIERLAQAPSPPRRATGTLALAILGGGIVSFAAMAIVLGFRPDLAQAVGTSSYWLKFLYPLALAAIAARVTERLARPGTSAPVAWLLLPPGVAAAAALAQWMVMPSAQHMQLLMGQSAALCPWRILALSLPLIGGTFIGLRTLAPTRPVVAGAAAGLFAGAAAAWIYAFACGETSAVFLAVWYTAGIALTALLGASIGRWALRW